MSKSELNAFMIGPVKLRVKLARAASTVNLLSLAFAGMFFWQSSEVYGSSIASYGFVALAIVILSAIILLATGVYRIIGTKALDDFEINMARKANHYAYLTLASFVLISLFLLYINSPAIFEFGFSRLQGAMGFLVWGFIDIVMVLPVAILAWLLPAADIDPNE